MQVSMISLLLILLGGGNDLLDHISPEVYWQQRAIPVSVETMTKQLEAPKPVDVAGSVRDLSSAEPEVRDRAAKQLRAAGPAALAALRQKASDPDPQVAQAVKTLISQINADARTAQVRKLMAIRMLGRLQQPQAIEVLKPLLQSQEPFVADYAQQSIARIEGKALAPASGPSSGPATRPGAVVADPMEADIWRVPANCALVGQLRRGGRAFDLDEQIKKLPEIPGRSKEHLTRWVSQYASLAAERIGNVRLDGLTFGVSDNIGFREETGFAIVVARGKYDSAGVRAVMHERHVAAQKLGDVEVFYPRPQVAAFFPGDDRAVLLAGPGVLPVAEVVNIIRQDKAKLKSSQEMTALIGSIDSKQPLWVVTKIVPPFKQGPMLPAFDTITLVGARKGEGMSLTVRGTGPDARQVQGAVAAFNEQVRLAKETANGGGPATKGLGDFLGSIQANAEGGTATVTGSFDQSVDLMMAPMMLIGADPALKQ